MVRGAGGVELHVHPVRRSLRIEATRGIAALLVGAALTGCAAAPGGSGGATDLPGGGAGPFIPVGDSAKVSWSAPFILSTADDHDDPWLVADGPALSLWMTARTRTEPGSRIDHADLSTLAAGFGPTERAFVAELAWEAGSVSAPSVLAPRAPGRPWLLFYAAGGKLGLATSPDGHSWSRRAEPILFADGTDEGSVLGSPAAVRLSAPDSATGVEAVRLYYLAAGAVWVAEANAARLEEGAGDWTRLDCKPSTPQRDAVVARNGVPTLVDLRRVTARLTTTPTGRVRHDLYLGGWTGRRASTDPTSRLYDTLFFGGGYAASYDGLRFDVARAGVLPTRVSGRAPFVLPYADAPPIDEKTAGGSLLFYVDLFGGRDSFAVAVGRLGGP
jgi:hypothetical protein